MSLWKDENGNDLNALVFRDLEKGVVSETKTIQFKNEYSYTILGSLGRFRIVVQLSNGEFTGGEDEQGQEMQDEQWVEVRKQGAISWTPVGGPYGLTNDATPVEEGAANYLVITDDLAPGDSLTFEVRVNVSADAATERTAVVRFGASHEES